MRRSLTGYNHNVRHGDAVYHVQTEDNGSRHEVVTDVFADGGRVIASRSSSYADALARDDLDVHVRSMMQTQHKELLLALRDGSLHGGEPKTDGRFGEAFISEGRLDEVILAALEARRDRDS